MHFYMFHPAKFNFETKHLSRLEKAIYREMIDDYMNNESPFPVDIEKLAWRFSCETEQERNALGTILDNFFIIKKDKKGVEHYHHKRLDAEIRAYRWGNKDNLGTQGGTEQGTLSERTGTPKGTDKERKERYKQERLSMINALTEIGLTIDKSISMADLRKLHNDKFNNSGTPLEQTGTDGNAGNTQNFDVEPLPVTSNQLNNSLSNAHEQKTADAVLEKAEQVKQANAQDIQNWVVPTLDSMRSILFQAGFQSQLNQKDYDRHCSDFKVYFAEQAILGKPIATDSLRKNKLRDWIVRDAQKKPSYQKKSPQTNEQRFGTKDDPLAVDVVWNQPVAPVSQMTYEEWEAEEKAKQAARASVKTKGFEVIE